MSAATKNDAEEVLGLENCRKLEFFKGLDVK